LEAAVPPAATFYHRAFSPVSAIIQEHMLPDSAIPNNRNIFDGNISNEVFPGDASYQPGFAQKSAKESDDNSKLMRGQKSAKDFHDNSSHQYNEYKYPPSVNPIDTNAVEKEIAEVPKSMVSVNTKYEMKSIAPELKVQDDFVDPSYTVPQNNPFDSQANSNYDDLNQYKNLGMLGFESELLTKQVELDLSLQIPLDSVLVDPGMQRLEESIASDTVLQNYMNIIREKRALINPEVSTETKPDYHVAYEAISKTTHYPEANQILSKGTNNAIPTNEVEFSNPDLAAGDTDSLRQSVFNSSGPVSSENATNEW
jgi:hypothetical protein